MSNYKETIDIAAKQIKYISINGCKDIKCKHCFINKLCDHFPEHSQFYANQMILMARSQNG